MHIDIAQIPQTHWLPDAACWTRESRPILVSPSLGTSMAFERDGQSWWTDGGIAIEGKCPASYRKKLENLGRWQADPAQKLTEGANKLITEAVNGADTEWVPAFQVVKGANHRSVSTIDVFVPKGAERLTTFKGFAARYIGHVLRQHTGARFDLSRNGDLLVARVEGKPVAVIMRLRLHKEAGKRAA